MENPMTRISRLKEYAAMKGPAGESNDVADLNYWSRRAEANSDGDKHRASDGPMKLQKTGKRMALRDTASAPKSSRKVDNVVKAAKADVNHVGSLYMRNVRRET
jgi:hypothetical protein